MWEMQSHSIYSLGTIVKTTIHLSDNSRLDKTSESASRTGMIEFQILAHN